MNSVRRSNSWGPRLHALDPQGAVVVLSILTNTATLTAMNIATGNTRAVMNIHMSTAIAIPINTHTADLVTDMTNPMVKALYVSLLV